MPSRPPHTTACTRSQAGSFATGMPRRMRCRTRSSAPGETSGACATGPVRRLAPSPARQRLRRPGPPPPPAAVRGPGPRRSTSRPSRTTSPSSSIATRSNVPSSSSPSSTARCSCSPITSACPASEVGAILGIPAGTVHSRLHYGARAMRAASPRSSAPPATTPGAGTMNQSIRSTARRLAGRGTRARSAEGLERALAATRRTPSGRAGRSPPRGSRRLSRPGRPRRRAPSPSSSPSCCSWWRSPPRRCSWLARRGAQPFGLAGNGTILLDVDGQMWQADADGSDPSPFAAEHLGLAYSPVFSPTGPASPT